MNPKVLRFLADSPAQTPFLVVDLDTIAKKYLNLKKLLPDVQIYYAVKANPAPEVLRLLVELGARFDAASIYEIEDCLAVGTLPEHISYGNTLKKAQDIARAYKLGVRLFSFDSLNELEKLASHAPGARVYCRILTEGKGAEWPLARKFGCELDMAHDLLLRSQELGLVPYGLSFHVGSQQMDPSQWDLPVSMAALLFASLATQGVHLSMVNIGGGFPAQYRSQIPHEETYTDAIYKAMNRHFGQNHPSIMIEPGRSLVADAGVIQSEVVLISQKSYREEQRWVFLDVGKFGGLIETSDECIKYRIRTPYDGDQTGPVVLAGPTCDSADILYEKAGYELPLDLKVGDKVQILSTGAYTHTYASAGFNGFPPLKAYCI